MADANERSEDNFCSMEITQEVRDFAAKQNSDSYLAATAPAERAEEGMERMSEVYREKGDKLYVPTDE